MDKAVEELFKTVQGQSMKTRNGTTLGTLIIEIDLFFEGISNIPRGVFHSSQRRYLKVEQCSISV